MRSISDIFELLSKNRSDINEHMETLCNYAKQVNSVTEFGVRDGNSTIAFLNAKPKSLISYDIIFNQSIQQIIELASAEKINFKFNQRNVLEVSIEPTDLLFIDTWHIYDQLKQELTLHSGKVSKYIIMHDTETFGQQGEQLRSDPFPNRFRLGLKLAIDEFLTNDTTWMIKEVFRNNNGLTILEKK